GRADLHAARHAGARAEGVRRGSGRGQGVAPRPRPLACDLRSFGLAGCRQRRAAGDHRRGLGRLADCAEARGRARRPVASMHSDRLPAQGLRGARRDLARCVPAARGPAAGDASVRRILLVTAREYRRMTGSPAFWIIAGLVPLIILAAPLVQRTLSRSQTIAYVLVDKTGRYARQIDQRLELDYQRQVLVDLLAYAQEWRAESAVVGAG